MSLAIHMGGAHHCSGPPVSEMTYTACVEWDVKLYYAIPYHTIPCMGGVHTIFNGFVPTDAADAVI